MGKDAWVPSIGGDVYLKADLQPAVCFFWAKCFVSRSACDRHNMYILIFNCDIWCRQTGGNLCQSDGCVAFITL